MLSQTAKNRALEQSKKSESEFGIIVDMLQHSLGVKQKTRTMFALKQNCLKVCSRRKSWKKNKKSLTNPRDVYSSIVSVADQDPVPF